MPKPRTESTNSGTVMAFSTSMTYILKYLEMIQNAPSFVCPTIMGPEEIAAVADRWAMPSRRWEHGEDDGPPCMIERTLLWGASPGGRDYRADECTGAHNQGGPYRPIGGIALDVARCDGVRAVTRAVEPPGQDQILVRDVRPMIVAEIGERAG